MRVLFTILIVLLTKYSFCQNSYKLSDDGNYLAIHKSYTDLKNKYSNSDRDREYHAQVILNVREGKAVKSKSAYKFYETKEEDLYEYSNLKYKVRKKTENSLEVVNIENNQVIASLENIKLKTYLLSWDVSLDGKYVGFTISEDKKFYIWDTSQSGASAYSIKGIRLFNDIYFNAKGEVIITHEPIDGYFLSYVNQNGEMLKQVKNPFSSGGEGLIIKAAKTIDQSDEIVGVSNSEFKIHNLDTKQTKKFSGKYKDYNSTGKVILVSNKEGLQAIDAESMEVLFTDNFPNKIRLSVYNYDKEFVKLSDYQHVDSHHDNVEYCHISILNPDYGYLDEILVRRNGGYLGNPLIYHYNHHVLNGFDNHAESLGTPDDIYGDRSRADGMAWINNQISREGNMKTFKLMMSFEPFSSAEVNELLRADHPLELEYKLYLAKNWLPSVIKNYGTDWNNLPKRLHSKAENCGKAWLENTNDDALKNQLEKGIESLENDSKALFEKLNEMQISLHTTGHTNRVSEVLYSPDGSEIITASWDKTVKVWNAKTGVLKRTIHLPASTGIDGMIYAADISPDGKYLALGGPGVHVDKPEKNFGEYFMVLDYVTGEMLDVAFTHNSPVFAIKFSDDGKYLATGSGVDKKACIFELNEKGKLLRNAIFEMTGLISGLDFDKDNFLYVTDVEGKLIRATPAVYNENRELISQAVGEEVYSAPMQAVMGKKDPFWDIDIHPSSGYILVGGNITPYAFPKITGENTIPFIGWQMGKSFAVKFHPDGKSAIVSSDKIIRRIDLSAQHKQINYPMEVASTMTEIINQNKTEAGYDQPGLIASFDKHNNQVLALDISPDGQQVVSSGGNANEVFVWDAMTGKELFQLGRSKSRKSSRIYKVAAHKSNPNLIGFGYFDGDDSKITHAFDLDELIIKKVDADDFVNATDLESQFKGKPNGPDGLDPIFAPVFGEKTTTFKFARKSYAIGGTYGIYLEPLAGKPKFIQTGVAAYAFNNAFDDKIILAGLADGRILFIDRIKGQISATLWILDEMDWLITTADNYYAASRGGATKVGWVKNPWGYDVMMQANEYEALATPMRSQMIRTQMLLNKRAEFVPFETFDAFLNRPDLVLSQVGSLSYSVAAEYYKAYNKRLSKLSLSDQTNLNLNSLPQVTLQTLPSKMSSRSAVLDVQTACNDCQITKINVFINDVPVFGNEGWISVTQGAVKIPVQLSAGQNKIQVSAQANNGLGSMKQTIYTSYDHNPNTTLHVIAIGVSNYMDSQYNLTYAAKDAQDVIKAFKSNSTYSQVKEYSLTDSDVTKDKIIALKSALNTTKVDDGVVIFFAGHGLLDKDFNYFLATYDVDFTNPAEKGLAYSEWENLLDGIPARKKLILLDACHSGEVDKSELTFANQTVAKKSTGEIKFRSYPSTPSMGLNSSYQMMQKLFTDLRRGTGATAISSSSGLEFSMESDEWKNGLFTYSLISGLKNKNADLDKNGNIQVSELNSYVSDQVSELSHGLQHPTTRQMNVTNDFVITQ